MHSIFKRILVDLNKKNIFSQLDFFDFLGPLHPSFTAAAVTAAATGWPQISPRRRGDNDDDRMDNAGKRRGGEERQRVRNKLEKKSHPPLPSPPLKQASFLQPNFCSTPSSSFQKHRRRRRRQRRRRRRPSLLPLRQNGEEDGRGGRKTCLRRRSSAEVNFIFPHLTPSQSV